MQIYKENYRLTCKTHLNTFLIFNRIFNKVWKFENSMKTKSDFCSFVSVVWLFTRKEYVFLINCSKLLILNDFFNSNRFSPKNVTLQQKCKQINCFISNRFTQTDLEKCITVVVDVEVQILGYFFVRWNHALFVRMNITNVIWRAPCDDQISPLFSWHYTNKNSFFWGV